MQTKCRGEPYVFHYVDVENDGVDSGASADESIRCSGNTHVGMFYGYPGCYSVYGDACAYDIREMNTKVSSISVKSAGFNLAVMDAAPDLEFSEVIWKAVKGLDSEMPAPVRSAFVKPLEEEEEGE